MRPLLRLLTTRNGLAMLLLVVVFAIVGVGRLVGGGPAPDPPVEAVLEGPSSIAAPATPDDGAVAASALPSTGPTSRRPGAASAEEVAAAFTRDWLNGSHVAGPTWLDHLRPRMTADLAGKLAGTDPAGVPASRVTGPVGMINHDPTFVEAMIPVDTGSVQLRLLLVKGEWLVDGIDWSRG
jgi:hypothetical protein